MQNISYNYNNMRLSNKNGLSVHSGPRYSAVPTSNTKVKQIAPRNIKCERTMMVRKHTPVPLNIPIIITQSTSDPSYGGECKCENSYVQTKSNTNYNTFISPPSSPPSTQSTSKSNPGEITLLESCDKLNEKVIHLESQLEKLDGFINDRKVWDRKIKEVNSRLSSFKKENISIPCLTLFKVPVHIKHKFSCYRLVYSGTHTVTITELSGPIEMSVKQGIQLQIIGEIKLFDMSNGVLYNGVIYWDRFPRVKLSSRPLAPIDIEFEALVQIDMRGIYLS